MVTDYHDYQVSRKSKNVYKNYKIFNASVYFIKITKVFNPLHILTLYVKSRIYD